ncbi:MAG: diphthine synthase [Candidatus Aenigmarchaeota archaeon]|nr:diphthine synthase [Candidatus Aenigmarchaeota archaeon]
MLYLVGLGIWDEKDISLKGIEACRRSSQVYAELYTARWGGSLKNLEKIIGKNIHLLERTDLEDDSSKLVRKSKFSDIAILFPGDPLSATTHLALVSEAKESKIPVKVIHSSSIFTAVAECGLSLYNFGRTVSIPTPQKNFQPSSFADSILENRRLGMHTLVLLDISMPVAQGIDILLGIEKSSRKKLISDQKIVAASGLGSDNQKILYKSAGELLVSGLSPPAVLIIPGKMHFTEKEFLDKL